MVPTCDNAITIITFKRGQIRAYRASENTVNISSKCSRRSVRLPSIPDIGIFFYLGPKPKILKTTPIERKRTAIKTASSSWREDPKAVTDLPDAISGPSVESLVRPELREKFEKCKWFLRTDTSENKAFDKRTPGLFKEEWSGEGIIGLSSKVYYCFGSYDKFSCKGINKNCNEINKEKYLNVLLTKQSSAGLNNGFRVVDNAMYTYQQVQDGFSYFYPKRKVLNDGVTILPLDI